MFKAKRSDKPSKKHCISCKTAFQTKADYKMCAVCQDSRYCLSCLVKCAQCPDEMDCYLCPSFHPHECIWPDCGKSLCQMHGLENPLSFGSFHDQRVCICDEHKERVVKRMREIVELETLQPRKHAKL